MKPVSGRVTLSKDERLLSAVPPLEAIGRVHYFVKYGDEMDGMGGGAWSVVVRVLLLLVWNLDPRLHRADFRKEQRDDTLTCVGYAMWDLWSAESRLTPSQQDGKKT